MKLSRNKIFIQFCLMFFLIYLCKIDTFATGPYPEGFESALKEFLIEYKFHMSAILGIGIFSGIGVFIYLLIKLGFYADRPFLRFMVIRELLICIITTALMGIIPLIYMLIVTSATG